jgi:DNA adenine methylase
MIFYSPLRYPGGKSKLAKFIASICEKNNINGHYVEPYAGGASVALYLLISGNVKKITINDLDRGIYAFWYSILNNTEEFCRKISNTRITVNNWKKFKEINTNSETADLFDLGFATFFLNRTNHSGIIDGGVIGGEDQEGDYKINCRFNKKNLIEKIRLIAARKTDIELFNLDALELVKQIQEQGNNENTIFYFDPPYYLKGPSLYLSHYKQENHKEVSEAIQKIENSKWIVSYDEAKEIKDLYCGFKTIEYSFLHVAHTVKKANEVLFFSENLEVDLNQNPVKV